MAYSIVSFGEHGERPSFPLLNTPFDNLIKIICIFAYVHDLNLAIGCVWCETQAENGPLLPLVSLKASSAF